MFLVASINVTAHVHTHLAPKNRPKTIYKMHLISTFHKHVHHTSTFKNCTSLLPPTFEFHLHLLYLASTLAFAKKFIFFQTFSSFYICFFHSFNKTLHEQMWAFHSPPCKTNYSTFLPTTWSNENNQK
jgi:hypothetical protein